MPDEAQLAAELALMSEHPDRFSREKMAEKMREAAETLCKLRPHLIDRSLVAKALVRAL